MYEICVHLWYTGIKLPFLVVQNTKITHLPMYLHTGNNIP